MATTKQFTFQSAFINPNNPLSELKTDKEENKDYPILSAVIAYMYAAVTNPELKVQAPDDIRLIMNTYFPKTKFISVKSEEEDFTDEDLKPTVRVKIISLSSERRREGLLMMPLFVSSGSTILYNIHNTQSRIEASNPRYNTAQANFFHKVVRSKTATNTRVIWKDPICNDTKMRETSYDETFLIFLADLYLKYVWEGYTELDSDQERLAACLEFSSLLKKHCTEAKVKTIRDFTDTISAKFFLPSNCIDVDIKAVKLDVNEHKSNLFDILYFIILSGLKADDSFALIVTGYDTYSHLVDVVKYFPRADVTIWDPKAPKFTSERISVKNSILTKASLEAITKKSANETTLIASARSNNDTLFKGINYSGRLMFPVGTTLLDPGFDSTIEAQAFMSMFTSKEKPRAQIIIAGGLKQVLDDEVASLQRPSKLSKGSQESVIKRTRKADVNNFNNWLANNYKDTNLWTYSFKNKEMSYDEASLNTLLDYIGVSV